jgi:hypothetical protein
MPTRGSVRHRSDGCCSPENIPPLSPLAYITLIFLPFISIVLGNAVTLRQINYAENFKETYGKDMQPLPDTAILQEVQFPTFTSRLAMRDWVNVLAGLWCTMMFILWSCKRNYVVFVTFLYTEALLVPVLAVSQWMTIIPDSDPQCLSSINVPEGSDWIWYRVSLVQCGDMIWSSAIVQTIIFSILGFSSYRSRCVHVIGCLLSAVVISIVAIVAWMSLYQYACDIILSFFVSMFVATHPFMRFAGMLLFYTDCFQERVKLEESEHLMSTVDEEFGITENDEDI